MKSLNHLKSIFVKTIILASFVLISLHSEANSGWSVAPNLSYNYFKLTGDTDLESKGNSGGGITVYKILDSDLEFQTGLLYQTAGGKKSIDFGLVSLTVYELNMNFLVAPIGTKWTFVHYGDGASSSAFLQGGINAAYLLSAKEKIMLASGEENDVKSNFKTLSAQYYLGIGGTKEMAKNQSFTYELNYVGSLTNLANEGNAKLSGYNLNLGYLITL